MRTIGIVMNGVTGRMGTNQHLERSITAIRKQGGVQLPDGEALMPDPILVGRNEYKLRALAKKYGIIRWTTDLQEALGDSYNEIYFDASTTLLRAQGVRAAIDAGTSTARSRPV